MQRSKSGRGWGWWGRHRSNHVQPSVFSCSVVFDSLWPLGSLLGSSVHGIPQTRILEWVAYPFSRETSWLRNRTGVSCIAGRFFTSWATREVHLDRAKQSTLNFIHSYQEAIKILSIWGGFPSGSAGKEFACNAGALGSIPELGRSPEGNGYPLQYSALENSMDCRVHGVTKSRKQLSNFHFHQEAIKILPIWGLT